MNRLSEHMAETGSMLNLVAHDVIASEAERRSEFDLTIEVLKGLIEWLAQLEIASSIRMYFDDNLRSQLDVINSLAGELSAFAAVVLAVPVTSIGMPGRGSDSDLSSFASLATTSVVPHGYSHVRLASYDAAGQLLPTSIGGPYADQSTEPLRENEVLFQFVESKEHSLFQSASEFVLPYGCYNQSTVALNDQFAIYETLSRAEFFCELDVGQELRPRFLLRGLNTLASLEKALAKVVAIP